jgi:hypothetical protein
LYLNRVRVCLHPLTHCGLDLRPVGAEEYGHGGTGDCRLWKATHYNTILRPDRVIGFTYREEMKGVYFVFSWLEGRQRLEGAIYLE